MKNFLLIVMITTNFSVALAMQTAGETPRPPIELFAEAIDNHDFSAFLSVCKTSLTSMTYNDWVSLAEQNRQHINKLQEPANAQSASCWRCIWSELIDSDDEDEYEDQLRPHRYISSFITSAIQGLQKKKLRDEKEARAARVEGLLEEHSRLLKGIQAVLERHNLVPEQPQIISEDIKQ